MATKRVRITLDLDPAQYRDLQRWIASAAVAAGKSRVSLAEALRAMITVTTGDTAATTQVLQRLRAPHPSQQEN